MKKFRTLKGGEHKWDGRYKDPIAKIYPQPLNDDTEKFRIGKYKGKHYLDKSIPNNYISWIVRNWANLNERNKRKLSNRLVQTY